MSLPTTPPADGDDGDAPAPMSDAPFGYTVMTPAEHAEHVSRQEAEMAKIRAKVDAKLASEPKPEARDAGPA